MSSNKIRYEDSQINVLQKRVIQSQTSIKQVQRPTRKGNQDNKINLNKKDKKENRKPQESTKKLLDLSKYQAIRYKNYDTIRYNKQYHLFQETDLDFIQDVDDISKKHKDVLVGNILSINKLQKYQLTDYQCDQIDYIANKHSRANRINHSYTQKNKKNQIDKCLCGCDKYQGKKFPFCTPLDELKFLGSGVLLIFMFIKTYAVIMALALIIYGVFALTTNFLGSDINSTNQCADQFCRFIINSSNQNKIEPHPMMIVQWWLGLGFSIIWLIGTKLTKYNGRKLNKEIDNKLKSASDKAVLIRNLPNGQYTQRQLLQYCQRLWQKMKKNKQSQQNNEIQSQTTLQEDNNNKFNISRIQIIYQMEFARKIIQKIIDLCDKINYILKEKPNNNNKLDQNQARLNNKQASYDNNKHNKVRLMDNRKEYYKLKMELIQLIQILGDLRNKFFYQQIFRKSLASNLCIIEFDQQKDKDNILESFGQQRVGFLTKIQDAVKNFVLRKTQGSLRMKGKYLLIERAPEPSDIQWEKCELQYSNCKTFGLYMLTIVIVCFSLVLIVLLDLLQQFVSQKTEEGYFSRDSAILTLISIGTSLVLLFVNKLLWFSLGQMVENEVNYTLSERINSRMNKALFATSVNIIALPILTNYVFKVDVFSQNGMTGLVFEYQLSTLLIGLPLKLFNPIETVPRLPLYVRAIRNKIIRKYCMQLDIEKEEYQQKGIKDINKFYQGGQFDVAESYVYIMGTIYHSMFFCQINPFVLVTGTLIVIGLFFVLKIRLFYFCKFPEMLDKIVFQTALSQISLAPVIYGAGAIVLSYIEHQIDPTRPVEYHQAFICMGLSLSFFFNPGDVFNKLAEFAVEYFSEKKVHQINENQNKVQNKDTYYQNSNSLVLLGFEKVIKGGSLDKQIQGELKRFCKKYITKGRGKKEDKGDHKLQQKS